MHGRSAPPAEFPLRRRERVEERGANPGRVLMSAGCFLISLCRDRLVQAWIADCLASPDGRETAAPHRRRTPDRRRTPHGRRAPHSRRTPDCSRSPHSGKRMRSVTPPDRGERTGRIIARTPDRRQSVAVCIRSPTRWLSPTQSYSGTTGAPEPHTVVEPQTVVFGFTQTDEPQTVVEPTQRSNPRRWWNPKLS